MAAIKRLKIGFIGAGKTGAVLAKYFINHGYEVIGFYSKSASSLKEISAITGSQAYFKLADLIQIAQLIFLSVNDDTLPLISQQIHQVSLNLEHKFFCHLSGFFPSTILKFKHVASLHPIFSFHSKLIPLHQIQAVKFTLEGEANTLKVLQQLLEHCGNKYYLIKAADKLKYHLCCVLATSGPLALAAWIKELSSDFYHLYPLIMEMNLNKIQNFNQSLNFTANLTGPLARNDTQVISNYLNSLNSSDKQLFITLFTKLINQLNPHQLKTTTLIDLFKEHSKHEI